MGSISHLYGNELFHLNIKKHFFTVRVMEQQHR